MPEALVVRDSHRVFDSARWVVGFVHGNVPQMLTCALASGPAAVLTFPVSVA